MDKDALDTVLDRERIGKAIKERRLQKGLSQVDFALMIGTGKSQFWAVEHGAANVGIDTIIRAARALGCHIEIVDDR